jgi:hypothetical protein
MALGVMLVIVGTILLLSSLDVIDDVTVGELWPLLLIGFGLVIIHDRTRRAWRRRRRHGR